MPNDILRGIADNPSLLAAVKAMVEAEFQVPLDTTDANEVLGQKVRARLDGLKAVEEAFRKISLLQTPKPREQIRNEAR